MLMYNLFMVGFDSKKFGAELKEVREEFGATQSEVARILGISLRAYQHYEAGTREISLSSLEILHRKIGLSIDGMFQKLGEDSSDE